MKTSRPSRSSSSPATRAAPAAARGTFGSLVLGVNEGGELRYVGNVGTGFDDAEIEQAARAAPAAPPRRDRRSPTCRRCRASARATCSGSSRGSSRRCAFGEWTHDGHLRQPGVPRASARTRRRGGDAREPAGRSRAAVGARRASASCGSRTSTSRSGRRRGSRRAICSRYYRAGRAGARPAPRRTGRSRCAATPTAPTARRSSRRTRRSTCPTGSRRFRALVSTRDAPRTKRWIDFPVVDDELALLWMVNMGCIDMNAWYSRVDKPDRPDFVLFDLDPTPEVPWTQTIEVALILKAAARRARPRVVPEDVGRQGLPRARAARPALDLRRHARVRGDRRRRDRARAPEARDDGVVEGEAARRADRREPERRGQDDRLRLLGAAAAGRARLDAARAGTR